MWYLVAEIDHIPNDSELPYGPHVRSTQLATPGHAHAHPLAQ